MTKEDESISPNVNLVLGYLAIKDVSDDAEKVEILSRFGYGIKDISIICNLTPSNVGVIRHRAKNKIQGKNGKNKKTIRTKI